MNPRNFFAELKRRNVYKVAVAYAVVGWLVMQIAATVVPALHLSDAITSAVVLLVILGFPIALILAWAFELTPEGIKRTEDVSPNESIALRSGRKLVGITVALALVAVALMAVKFLRPKSPTTAAPATTSAPATAAVSPVTSDKSIAVLPFQSLSKDDENAFFADGVQDQILTDLAKVADLKVISRTSVMQYKNAAVRNLREIAQQLGVAHVLEGSVQRAGSKVRVTAQLINALTDAHEWAENYDRPVDDVFAIQSEIAKTIAEQLQAKIAPREEAAMSQAPTTDLEANRLFLKAKELEEVNTDDPRGKQNLLRAEQLLHEALARDSMFLTAYCLLLTVNMDLYFGGHDHTPARLALAKTALEHASQLQPDAGEVHLARVDYLYHGFRDYDAARAELELARRTLPNHGGIPYFTALMDRRQGRWIEAERNFARTLELDPRNVGVLYDTGDLYRTLRQYGQSNVYMERVVAISRHQYFYRAQIAENAFLGRADVAALRTQIDTLLREKADAAGGIIGSLFRCALAERDSAVMTQAIAAIPPEGLQEQDNSFWPGDWYAGLAKRSLGDRAGAERAFTAARVTTERTLEDQPDYAPAWSQLALIDAALGHKEQAIREARHACELLPLSKDTLVGPVLISNLAMVYAWTGEKDLAFEQLKISAEIPNGASYGELKLYPQWDPLRGDPRFEKIVASLAPKNAQP